MCNVSLFSEPSGAYLDTSKTAKPRWTSVRGEWGSATWSWKGKCTSCDVGQPFLGFILTLCNAFDICFCYTGHYPIGNDGQLEDGVVDDGDVQGSLNVMEDCVVKLAHFERAIFAASRVLKEPTEAWQRQEVEMGEAVITLVMDGQEAVCKKIEAQFNTSDWNVCFAMPLFN